VRVQPFWSSRSRVERIVKSSRAYRGFTPVALKLRQPPIAEIDPRELDGMDLGENRSGPNVSGYDLPPSVVREAIEWQIEHITPAG
jgi:hypothetical protein